MNIEYMRIDWLFAEKEEGHDEWVKSKVAESLTRLKEDGLTGRPASEVHASIMAKVRLRLESKGV